MSAAAQLPSVHRVSLHSTSGALQIGISLSLFLFGIISVQTYHYYQNFPDDRRLFRYLVATMWFLELAHTTAISYELYQLTVSTPRGGVLTFPGLGSALIVGGVITTLVQCFFSLRLWRLFPQPFNYVGLTCAVISVFRCIGSAFLGTQAVNTSVEAFRANWTWLITLLLSAGAALDVAIALAMLYFLLYRRQDALTKMSNPRVSRVIDRLVAFTISECNL